MAEGETKLKRGHARSWWVNAALISALAIAAVVTFFILGDWQRTRLSFRVDEHVSMHMVDVLHDGNEELEPRAWLRKLYGLIPEKVKSKTAAWWQPELVLIKEDLEVSAVALVFKPQVRTSFSTAPGKAGRRQRAHSSALSSDIGLRLRFDNHGYTGIEAMSSLQNHLATGAGNQWGQFFGCSFYPVPLTARELTVEVLRGEPQEIRVIKQVKISNPAYRDMQPIGNPAALPATVIHDDVSVTLEAVVSNTISGLLKNLPASSADSAHPYIDPETLEFPRHDGKAIRPASTAVAIRVNDDGCTGSAWRVNELRFLYGDNILYPQQQQWNPLDLTLDRGLVQIFTFPNDVGVLEQPVKVIAQLARQRDFEPEDLITVTEELPTTGTYSNDITLITGKDADSSDHHSSLGRAAFSILRVSNQATIPFTQMEENQEGVLTVMLMSPNELAQIHKVELIAFDGRERDLSDYLMTETKRYSATQKTYDLYNRNRNPDGPAVDTALFDTIRITVAIPKVFHKQFEFIANPTKAQLPARPGVY